MTKENKILSWENGHLTMQTIESYNKGSLSDLDTHKVERHILNCDLCAEALEGFRQKPGSPKVRKNLETLRHQIRKKSERPEKSGSTVRTLGIAASIVVVLGVGLYYFQDLYLPTPEEPQIALRQEEPAKTQDQPEEESSDFFSDALATVDDSTAGISSQQENIPNQNVTSQETEGILALNQPQAAAPRQPDPKGENDQNLPASAADKNSTLDNEQTDTDVLAEELEFAELAFEESPPIDQAQTEAEPMTDENLEKTKEIAADLAQASAAEGGPQLTSSSRLTSGAKLGGSIMDSDPEPEIGFEEYKVYLTENLQYPEEARLNNISGVVKIGFVLKPGSSYSKFKIIEGLGNGCDQEAERLIKEGPNWKPAVRKGLATKEEVIVEIRFE